MRLAESFKSSVFKIIPAYNKEQLTVFCLGLLFLGGKAIFIVSALLGRGCARLPILALGLFCRICIGDVWGSRTCGTLRTSRMAKWDCGGPCRRMSVVVWDLIVHLFSPTLLGEDYTKRGVVCEVNFNHRFDRCSQIDSD